MRWEEAAKKSEVNFAVRQRSDGYITAKHANGFEFRETATGMDFLNGQQSKANRFSDWEAMDVNHPEANNLLDLVIGREPPAEKVGLQSLLQKAKNHRDTLIAKSEEIKEIDLIDPELPTLIDVLIEEATRLKRLL